MNGEIPHTFFTVSSASFFPGTVALLNSLRLTGHTAELVVLNVGLAPHHVARLEPHCRLVSLPQEDIGNPLLFKAFPAVLRPEGVVVIIDADIIVTGDLTPIVERAAAGAICAFPDTDADRWFAEWESLFGLSGPPRRQTYVNSGFVALSVNDWPQLLDRWRGASESIPPAATRAGGAAFATPLWDGDQDALNAVLMAEVPDAVTLLPPDAGPTNDRARLSAQVVDVQRLRCTLNGTDALLVHAAGTPKPWQIAGRGLSVEDAYVQLLPRVLFGKDVPLALDRHDVPLRLRSDAAARLAVASLNTGYRLLDRVPPAWRSRLKRAVTTSRHTASGGK